MTANLRGSPRPRSPAPSIWGSPTPMPLGERSRDRPPGPVYRLPPTPAAAFSRENRDPAPPSPPLRGNSARHRFPNKFKPRFKYLPPRSVPFPSPPRPRRGPVPAAPLPQQLLRLPGVRGAALRRGGLCRGRERSLRQVRGKPVGFSGFVTSRSGDVVECLPADPASIGGSCLMHLRNALRLPRCGENRERSGRTGHRLYQPSSPAHLAPNRLFFGVAVIARGDPRTLS